MHLHLHRPFAWTQRSAARHGDPSWWRRIAVDRLVNPLDQLIVALELITGGAFTVVGAGLASFASMLWPWMMVGLGIAVIAIALAAILRAVDA